jgi:preprotein translocase subunit SecA
LGGLHVVGSERHESRRIDNQLRGRAARQGDPGSSRFFLSLEDDLMLRFGGERLNNLMNRINIPEDMPIESGMLDRLIENSQTRLEGYNFDIRKNLVEYDDVMNRQRAAIYSERRAILLGEDLDLDGKIERAFKGVIDRLADNYLDNYTGYVQGEINRAIVDFSTDATDEINIRGVIYRLRALLPQVATLQEDLQDANADQITARLMKLAEENVEKGSNVLQLLQAMGGFLPLVPAVPNVGVRVAAVRSGRLQVREQLRRDYISRLEDLYNGFLAQYVKDSSIWQTALKEINDAFLRFNVERMNVDQLTDQQPRLKEQVDGAVTHLLLTGLESLDSDELVAALNQHIKKQAEDWRKAIGDDEYRNYQRLLLLSAIDREWRDYLTAVDDLRREIGLSAIAQRDPKVEYKRRSFEMFEDMRNNINRDVVNRFFSGIGAHQRFIQEQQERAKSQLVLNRADDGATSSSNGQRVLKPKRREPVAVTAGGEPRRSRREKAEKKSKRKYRRGKF